MNMTKESDKKNYLIIARVGDTSLHRLWLEPKEFRSFDLCLCYYGEQPGRYEPDCNYYSEAEGNKWPLIKKIVEGFGNDIKQYQAIWIPDEHISTNAFNINQMFHIFCDQELWLAQPAFTDGSYTPTPAMLRHPEFILRYVSFGEMTVPIFSSEALTACVTAMDANPPGREHEFIWPKELPYPNKQTAVIDETPVKLPSKTSLQEQNTEAPPLLIRNAGRAGRSGRSRRFLRSRKKTNLKQKFIQKQKLKKTQKSKPVRKLKKSVRIPKPFINHKWKYPAAHKKKLPA